VAQPVPEHCALVSITGPETIPAVAEMQPLGSLSKQVECAVAWPASALTCVVLVVAAGQPVLPSAPLVQEAWAAAEADPLNPVGPSTTVSAVEVVTEAWQPADCPVQAVCPCEVELVLGWGPLGLAIAVASPVIEPVQLPARQSSAAEVRVVPLAPGRFFAFLSVLAGCPLSLVLLAVAVAATPQPAVLPDEQVARVVELPELPGRSGRLAWLVAAAVQPVVAHRAEACDWDWVAGALVIGVLAVFAASVAAWSACFAVAAALVAAALVAAVFCASVAPGAAAICCARVAAWSAWVACCCAWVAAVWFCTAMVSATTWPAPAVELVAPWHPDWALEQVAVVEASPAGGPRDPVAPLTVFGPSLPTASECTEPTHPLVPP
jgi:hypothetical protein